MYPHLQREQVRSLLIDLFADFLRDILVDFVLDEFLDGVVNARVDLPFDSREDYGSIFGAFIWILLTLHREVLKDLIVEGLLQQFCQTITSVPTHRIRLHSLLISSFSDDCAEVKDSRSFRILQENKRSIFSFTKRAG